MRTLWRDDRHPLHSHQDWCTRIDRKNRRRGTSAPTLAQVWAGPVELFGVLRQQPALDGFRIDEVAVEARSAVDGFSGPRNHDLVVRGHLRANERVVVCVEAKAGESLGRTVAEQAEAAATAVAAAKKKSATTGRAATSNATARLEGLLQRFVHYPRDEPRVLGLRYQLLTALAGTISEAEAAGAHHAVLMIHEFLTDHRADERVVAAHERDLRNFCTAVFGFEPAGGRAPWCVALPPLREPAGATLYLARVITDLRSDTLEQHMEGEA